MLECLKGDKIMFIFEIEILIDKCFFKEIRKEKIYYYKEFYDSITFSENRILITGNRSNRINIHTAFESKNSNYLYEMTLALIYTYFLYNNFEVLKIKISTKHRSKSDEEIKELDITQRFTKKLDQLHLLEEKSLQRLFDPTSKSKRLIIALSHLTLGLSTENQSSAFDNLWKCFNVLMREVTNKSKDSEMLKDLKIKIENSPEKFPKSIQFANNLTKDELEVIAINELIENIYPNIKKEKKFLEMKKHMLLAFEDSRICELLIGRINRKKKDFTLYDPNNEIRALLDKRVLTRTKNNTDIIRLLILKYAYYLRCKYFHGEKSPQNFLMLNFDTNQLDFIHEPLLNIIYDVIQSELL